MRIQHNIMAMSAYRNYNTNTSAVANLLHSALSGLHQGDAILDVLLSGVQTGDLSTHLLRNSQTLCQGRCGR